MSFRFRMSRMFAHEVKDPVGDLFAVLSRDDIISFAGGVPDDALFDFAPITEAFEHVLRHDGRRALQYGATQGDPALLEVAAAMMSKKIATTPSQLQITTGSQEGIYLAASVLVDPGDIVLVEEPTYLAAVQAFQLVGATLVGVESDDEGMVPDALRAAIALHRPKAVYLVPSFQNPSGRTMPLARRQAIAEVLLATDVALVEDDPYGELRFEGEAVAPIAAMPGMAERTLLLNSLSKVMAPGVRVGWLRCEGEIMTAISVAKAAVTLQSSALTQKAVARYLTTHDLDAHVRAVASIYRTRRDAMYTRLRQMLPNAAVTRPSGGMFCWVDLREDVDTQELLEVALRHGVAFVPGWSFYASRPNRATMRLSYVTNDPDTIEDGLARLGRALEEYRAGVR